jgi:hypothetical protein
LRLSAPELNEHKTTDEDELIDSAIQR